MIICLPNNLPIPCSYDDLIMMILRQMHETTKVFNTHGVVVQRMIDKVVVIFLWFLGGVLAGCQGVSGVSYDFGSDYFLMLILMMIGKLHWIAMQWHHQYLNIMTIRLAKTFFGRSI